MASRLLSTGARALSNASVPARATRNFQTSSPRLSEAIAGVPLQARKPVGAFRGGLFGFLLGSSLAGTAVYSYGVREYRASNDLLMEDIYALQAATQRMSTYLTTLEEKIEAMERKKK